VTRGAMVAVWLAMAAAARGAPVDSVEVPSAVADPDGTTTPEVVDSTVPVLTASSARLLAATVEATDLRAGRVEAAGHGRSRTLRLDVRPPQGFGPWRLTLRRQPRAGAPALRWKRAEEAAHEFRDVGQEPVAVAERPGGGDARVGLDMVWEIGWDTPPGRYGSSLEFELEPL